MPLLRLAAGLAIASSITLPPNEITPLNRQLVEGCDCEAYRLAVSLHLGNSSVPSLPSDTRQHLHNVMKGEEADPNYNGCQSLLVSGTAPSEACGMRWGFGVYERVDQCGHPGGPKECGDWGGHPVYKHSWKGNYLWGDFDQVWFLGTQVGNYAAIYGYIENKLPTRLAEDIDPAAKWQAYDINHWVDASVKIVCVPPEEKRLAIAPTMAPSAFIPDADGQTCEYLFMDGWASVYSTGLLSSFGEFQKLSIVHEGRPVYKRISGTKPAFLYYQPTSRAWVVGREVGGEFVSGFANSEAANPLKIADDPSFTHRRWVGVVPQLATFTPAEVKFHCLNSTAVTKPVVPPITPVAPKGASSGEAQVQIVSRSHLNSSAHASNLASQLELDSSSSSAMEVTALGNNEYEVVISTASGAEAAAINERAVSLEEVATTEVLLRTAGAETSSFAAKKQEASLASFPELSNALADADQAALAFAVGRSSSACDDDISTGCVQSLGAGQEAVARCLMDLHQRQLLSDSCGRLVQQLQTTIEQRDAASGQSEQEVVAPRVARCERLGFVVVGALIVAGVAMVSMKVAHRRGKLSGSVGMGVGTTTELPPAYQRDGSNGNGGSSSSNNPIHGPGNGGANPVGSTVLV